MRELSLNINSTLARNNKLLIALGIVLILSLVSTYIFISFLIFLVTILIYIYGKKVILGLIIISYLIITTEFFEEYRIYITIVVSALLLLLFLQEFGLKTENFVQVPKQILFFLAFLFVTLLISTVFSSRPLIGFIAIVRMAFFFIICYIFYSLLQNEENIYVYIYSLFVVVFALGVRMMIDVLNLGFERYFIRVLLIKDSELYSSVGYTGLIIFFLSLSLVTSMFFMRKFNLKWKKFLLISFLVINVFIILLANSRGGIMAGLISISFTLIILRRTLFFKILSSVIIISAILIFTIPFLQDTIENYLRLDRVNTRDIYWQLGIEIIQDHPVFGVGTDQYEKYFHSYAPSSIYKYFESGAGVFGKPHPQNFFLFYSAENGIMGLITSISFFVLFFYFAVNTMKITKKHNYDYYILSVVITGIGIGIFFRSFLEITGYLTYGYITTDLPFWLIFGILIYIYQKFKLSQKNVS